MPKLVNHNGHAIRVTDEDGKKHRLRSGQVVDVSGAAADALKGVKGVESANKADEDAWARARGALKEGGSQRSSIVHVTGILTEAKVAGRMASVVLPLSEVIGDDNAPDGPPSGTITTKQAVDHPKFGQRERSSADAENEGLNAVERKQASRAAELEELQASVASERDAAPAEDEPAGE